MYRRLPDAGVRALHEQIRVVLRDDAKAESFVQSFRVISDRDVQRHRRSEASRPFDDVRQQPVSDALPARSRHERDVQHPHVVGTVIHVQTPDRTAVAQDDQERRVRVMPAVMRTLKVELHPQESICLRRTPSDARELVGARGGVQRTKERLVVVPFVTQREAIGE